MLISSLFPAIFCTPRKITAGSGMVILATAPGLNFCLAEQILPTARLTHLPANKGPPGHDQEKDKAGHGQQGQEYPGWKIASFFTCPLYFNPIICIVPCIIYIYIMAKKIALSRVVITYLVRQPTYTPTIILRASR